jgi:hypothetical protein
MKKQYLFIAGGVILTAGGTFAINHIENITHGMKQSVAMLIGLGIGGLPVILGVLFMVLGFMNLALQLKKQRQNQ